MSALSSRNRQDFQGAFIAMVCIMALIGFVTGINQQFLAPIRETLLEGTGDRRNTFSTMITFALFLSYFLMGPLGARSVETRGYKKTIIVGLIIVSVGILLFEGSAYSFANFPTSTIRIAESVFLPKEFFVFLLGSFVSGTGLTFLQASVNPYIIACNVGKTTGVQRQNIAGTANSTMTMIAPIFVSYVLFAGKESDAITIENIMIPMAILTLVVLALAGIVSRVSLPHIEGTTSSPQEHTDTKMPFREFKHLYLGVVAIFVYVGVEVCVGANITLYAMQDLSASYQEASQMATLYWGAMLVGRLVGSFIQKVSARTLLTSTSITAFILILIAIYSRSQYFLIGVGLFHSVMWGAIFALSIDKLGIRTSKGTGLLMMGVVGGAVIPLLQSFLADAIYSWTPTWGLVALGELYLLYYALWGSKNKKKEI